jgi:transposase-like protein
MARPLAEDAALGGQAIKTRGHFPTELAPLECLYLVTRSLNPTAETYHRNRRKTFSLPRQWRTGFVISTRDAHLTSEASRRRDWLGPVSGPVPAGHGS